MSGIIPRTASLEHITMNRRVLALALGAVAFAAGVLPLVAAQVPASDEAAKATLDQSTRHGEWVGVFDGLQNTRTFIVHPQRGGRSPFVIVVSDNRGLTDWIRAVGDQLAQDGFTALVPDLLSDGPNPTMPQVVKRLGAVWDYGSRLPGMNGKSGIVAIGSGSAHALSFAAGQPALNATVIFSSTPAAASLTEMRARGVLDVIAGESPGTMNEQWPMAVAFLRDRLK